MGLSGKQIILLSVRETNFLKSSGDKKKSKLPQKGIVAEIEKFEICVDSF